MVEPFWVTLRLALTSVTSGRREVKSSFMTDSLSADDSYFDSLMLDLFGACLNSALMYFVGLPASRAVLPWVYVIDL